MVSGAIIIIIIRVKRRNWAGEMWNVKNSFILIEERLLKLFFIIFAHLHCQRYILSLKLSSTLVLAGDVALFLLFEVKLARHQSWTLYEKI